MVTKIYKVGAEWCGPCRQLKQELKNFNLVPIIEINADEDEEFCEKYNIKNIPVLLLCDNNNNVLYRQVGFISKEDLTRKIIEINENI
ncbi:MAG: thioredoxin family protein [Clostridiales bacterium]|uniref:thioredoxin family protein n=1 Tax=Terrisporobacter sp. TaxID=1965305 RepID=UPI002A530ADC|nr:thioredoxin family protein [Terrisporobacter sp.]MDD7753400.1 thioredoxin family protein [Clostridiales bacterium]MDY4134792.1 thioredoxin family protein [Terrisporobacter sp.]